MEGFGEAVNGDPDIRVCLMRVEVRYGGGEVIIPWKYNIYVFKAFVAEKPVICKKKSQGW